MKKHKESEFQDFIKYLRNPLNLSKKTRNKPIIRIIRLIALIMMILSFIGFIWTNWNS